MNIDELYKASERFAIENPIAVGNPMRSILKSVFETGALSDAAKQYWFEQFKAEQKQTIVTELPEPYWDDSVTHKLELVSKDAE